MSKPSNPFAFTRDRLFDALDRQPVIAAKVARTFIRRFVEHDGREDDAAWSAIEQMVDSQIDTTTERRFFETLICAAQKVRQTNLTRENRLGLALSVDATLFARAGRAVPTTVAYVHAEGTDGFHVRFRKIARGGVRAVVPRGTEQYLREAERLFEEVYDLAQAQQLKNKDIPEGGAKGVVLIAPGTTAEDGVKAYIDGLLDLLDAADEDRLYLGPDENISPQLIEWVVNRAAARGYPEPTAFMSSKPGAGINHKAFGVTSEGVTVFLEEALKAVGIDPKKEHFTVKMTGGPDGDVAGNEIKILNREFKDRAKIVAIADGSGSGWDPDGLDHEELLRLVQEEKPIAAFNTDRLGANGGILPVDRPGGFQRRNALPFEVVADAFIPAGGRPQTIHATNWRRFIHDGTPSSRVIVEGANLFLTPEARHALSDAGVVIVKDSSANKCGVICSSYEIAASLLLSADEFLKLKPRFVEEVLIRLRHLARAEAQLLLAPRAWPPSMTLP
ncbi:MAG: NAD-glutamate dehydrogenase domain-containing protein, partial [Myxococcota bacterium]